MTPKARQAGNGQHAPALASLERSVQVRLVNIGRAGCLLESPFAVEPDSVGMLQVAFESEVYEDLVRVVRAQPMAGRGSVHHVGVMFVWNDAPGVRSLRRLAHDLPTDATRESAIVLMRAALNR